MSGSDLLKRREFIRHTAAGAAAIGLGASALPSMAESKKPKEKPKFRTKPKKYKQYPNFFQKVLSKIGLR